MKGSKTRNALLPATVSCLAVCLWSSAAQAEAQVAAQNAATGASQPASAQPSSGQTAAARARAAQQASSTDIIVTAQRRAERLSQVPISVQAASGEMLARAGINDATSIPHISAAVSFTGAYNPESTSLSMRGVQSVANEGGVQPSVAVVIDGMPVARQAEFVADLADIDRIEVLAGPQGTLFGKNSTGGVVNILTKNPTFDYGMTFSTEATNDRETLTKTSINVPLSDRVAVRANGYYHYIDTLSRNIGPGPDGLGERAYGGEAKLLFQASDATKIVLTSNYNHGFSTFGINYVVVPNGGFGSAAGLPEEAILGPAIGRGKDVFNQDGKTDASSKSYSFIGEIDSKLSDSLTLTSISGYRRYDGKTHIDIDATPAGYRQGIGYSPNPTGYPIEHVQQTNGAPDYTYKYFSQEVRLNYDKGPINAVGGIFYQNYNDTRTNFLPIIFSRAFFSLNSTNAAISDDTYAGFADVTYHITNTLSAFGGLRYTHEEIKSTFDSQAYFAPLSQFDPDTGAVTATPSLDVAFKIGNKTNNLSGRAGLQWRPAPNMNFYASYNRGYKGPAVNQGRDVTGPVGSILRPELADAFELGAKPRFMDGHVGLDLALYYQRIKNIQQASVIPGTILTSLLNAGDLKTKGFQVDAFVEPVRGLTLRSAVVYNDAKYANGAVEPRFGCGPSATPGVGACGADGTFSLVGMQAVGSPRWKVVSSVDYTTDLNEKLRLYFRASYDWRSSVQYSLTEDPLTRERADGFLDASIGLGSTNESWRLSLFGHNLTNRFYYANLTTADGFIGQEVGNLARDYKRYGGLRLEAKF